MSGASFPLPWPASGPGMNQVEPDITHLNGAGGCLLEARPLLRNGLDLQIHSESGGTSVRPRGLALTRAGG